MLRFSLRPRALPALALAGLLALAAAPSAPVAAAWPAAELSEAARWLRDYLRIDTSNPPGFEHRAASYLAYLLHRERIPTRLFVTPEGRASLYARLEAEAPRRGEGAAAAGGPLVLLHHMDVVPAGPDWQVEPFAGRVVDGTLWGRGALDTKSLGIAHLAAFVELKRRRLPLARDVVFLGVADEETGGSQGMAWLLAHHPELFAGAWAVFNEGGSGRVVNGRMLWWEVEVVQKRPLWLELATRGLGGHGSNLNQESAVHQLIAALDRVLQLPRPYRAGPAARQYFSALAPLHRGGLRDLFADVDAQLTDPPSEEPVDRLPPGLYKLLTDTVQVTVFEGSDSINVIPATASAKVDVRLLPDTDAGRFLAAIESALGDDVEVEVLVATPPSPPSPTDHPAYRAVAEVLGREAPVVPGMMAGFTDSRFFRERGIPAYGVSPFAVEPLDKMGIHAPDELIRLDAFDEGVERMRRIIEACVVRLPAGAPKH